MIDDGRLMLDGLRVVVVGFATTGQVTARVLAERGARVLVSDARRPEDLSVEPAFLAPGVELELGGHREESFTGADLVIPSPGVPRDLPALQAAVRAGVRVWSEIELAARLIPRPILAVTGTNGKSTTVQLLGSMLESGGRRAPVVGNIGPPLVGMVGKEADFDCLVVEVSSFQLEWVEEFRPVVAAVLNVTDDHLDRYRDLEDYRQTKLRIAAVQDARNTLVLNAGDPLLAGVEKEVASRVLWFGNEPVERGVWRRNNLLVADLTGNGWPVELLDVRELFIHGTHNVENVMAAAGMALAWNVPPAAVREAALAYRSLPHRNELVAETGGVRWFDDSKGTNVGAVVKSLEGFERPVILIAGGREKGGSYAPLASQVKSKVKLLVLIGEARERMRRELGGLTRTVEVSDMDEAVQTAAAAATPGDTVLLSPACSSFDMFTGYHQRGEVYRKAIGRLSCPRP